MSDTNILQAGGDVEIRKLTIESFDGKVMDITQLLVDITIYEDLFSHSLSGNIVLSDTFNLLKKFPIIGEERIQIEYITPGFDDSKHTVSHEFMVYKSTNVTQGGVHKQVYALHFCTQETMLDLNIKISKALKGSPDSIIKSVLGKDFLDTKKKSEIEGATNTIKFVPAFWSPFKCINYALSRSQSGDSAKSSAFFFFETTHKYKFASIDKLLSAGNTKKISYKRNEDTLRDGKKFTDRDVESELGRVQEYQIEEGFDLIRSLLDGAFSHRVWEHNLLLKTIKKHTHIYEDMFSKSSNLGKYKIVSDKFKVADNSVVSTTTTYPKIHNDIKTDKYGEIIASKIPMMSKLNFKKVTLTVNGRSDIEVGDIVDVDLGGVEQMYDEDKKKPKTEYYSGKHLVTAICHTLTLKKHLMVMQVVKDSSEEKYESWKEE